MSKQDQYEIYFWIIFLSIVFFIHWKRVSKNKKWMNDMFAPLLQSKTDGGMWFFGQCKMNGFYNGKPVEISLTQNKGTKWLNIQSAVRLPPGKSISWYRKIFGIKIEPDYTLRGKNVHYSFVEGGFRKKKVFENPQAVLNQLIEVCNRVESGNFKA